MTQASTPGATLQGKTIFITGASRGIGKAIALRAARDGARVIIAAKTAEPHPKLQGTIYTAAEEIRAAGGEALACVVDVRDESSVQRAVDQGVEEFGGIDILINNAGLTFPQSVLELGLDQWHTTLNVNLLAPLLLAVNRR